MKYLLLSLTGAALLSAPAVSQTCTPGSASLTSSVTTAAPGSMVGVDVLGAPDARVLMFRAANQGATTLGNLTLCLDGPEGPRFLGTLDSTGVGSGNVRIPAGAMPGSTVYFQAVTLDRSTFPPTADTSNVLAIAVGTPPPPAPCTPGAVGLDIQPDVPVLPGTTVTIDVTATPDTFVWMVRGSELGSTPIGSLGVELCLESVGGFRRLGRTDAMGMLHRQFDVPVSATLPVGTTIYHQCVTLDFSAGMLAADTSNTDTIQY